MPEFATGGPIEALSPNARDFIGSLRDLGYPGYLVNAAAAEALDGSLLDRLNRGERTE